MKNKKDKTLLYRKDFTNNFYQQNKWNFSVAMISTVLTSVGTLLVSWLMQQIIDTASGMKDRFSLLQLALILAVIVAELLLASILDYYARPRFVKRAMRQYKEYVFEQMSKKNINAFSSETTSYYISALSNDASSIENHYLSQIFTMFGQILTFAGAFALMLYYSPLLTLVAFLITIIPMIASVLTGNRLAEKEKLLSQRNENFVGMVKDLLSGFAVIKSFKAENQVISLFKRNNDEVEDAKCRRRRTESIIQIIGFVSGLLTQFGVFLFGAYLAISGSEVTAGIIIVFVQLMNYVLSPIAELPQILANRKAAYALIDKLAEAVHMNLRKSGSTLDPVLKQGIELKNLSFAYEENTPVLKNFNFRFETGKSYAVVGGSGSGKSTLLNLLMGGSENYSGEILYDGNELRNIDTASLYDIISMVQQNVFVFNSTIHDNITMFKDFSKQDVERVTELSGVSALIAERGTDYVCGENGSGLSGGERQRISIARCLLRGTPVMLVDEATAALDSKTAYEVSKSILDISGLTRIVVTHRLEEILLRKYDEILVLKNGVLEENGTFDALMEKKQLFYSLFTVSQ